MLLSSHHQRHTHYYSVVAAQGIRGSTTGRLPALQTPAGVLDKQKRDAALLSQLPPPHAVLPQDTEVQSGSSLAWASPWVAESRHGFPRIHSRSIWIERHPAGSTISPLHHS
jgi:hypothetical protein